MRTWQPRFMRQAAAVSPPRPAPAIRTLVGTDASGPHGVAPYWRLTLHERRELRRCVAERLDADLAQPLGRRWLAHDFGHFLREALDDWLRRAARREEAVPRASGKSGIGLGDRRHVRKLRRAARAGDSKEPDLAALRMLDQLGGVAEVHLHLAADEIRHC